MSAPELEVLDAEEPAAAGAAPAAIPGAPPWMQMLLTPGAGGDASAIVQALLASQSGGGGNEQLAMLMQMLQASRSPAPQPPPHGEGAGKDDDEDNAERATAPLLPDAADVQALVVHARAMEQEIEGLRERNDSLAAALGACYLCFGQDANCPHCKGRGLPGRRAPQPAYFQFWVQPVLDRWISRADPRHAAPGSAAWSGAQGTGPPPHTH